MPEYLTPGVDVVEEPRGPRPIEEHGGMTGATERGSTQPQLICLIGVAPIRPAEFVIFRISQKTA